MSVIELRAFHVNSYLVQPRVQSNLLVTDKYVQQYTLELTHDVLIRLHFKLRDYLNCFVHKDFSFSQTNSTQSIGTCPF